MTTHDLYVFYLIGCILAAPLIVVQGVICGLLAWITKANILKKNLKKLDEPTPFLPRAVGLIFGLALSVALSWISVVWALLAIIGALLGGIRALFSSTPEAIKSLKFPLMNNPYMPRESVWAHVQALEIKGAGMRSPSPSDLVGSLDLILGLYPTFDREAALKNLSGLNVVSADVITAAMNELSKQDADEEFIDDEPSAPLPTPPVGKERRPTRLRRLERFKHFLGV